MPRRELLSVKAVAAPASLVVEAEAVEAAVAAQAAVEVAEGAAQVAAAAVVAREFHGILPPHHCDPHRRDRRRSSA